MDKKEVFDTWQIENTLQINLLKVRKPNLNHNFTLFEDKYQISIPPLLRIFFDLFEWNSDLVDGEYIYYYYPELSGGEIFFPFKNIEEHLYSSINLADDDVLEREFIVIAENRYGFYVGTQKGEEDKIFTQTNSIDDFTLVANNIFEFLEGITDNLSDVAKNEEEYRQFMIALGAENDDLEQDIKDWKNYKGLL